MLGFAVLVALAALAVTLWNARRLGALQHELRTYSRSLDARLREERRRAHEETASREERRRAEAGGQRQKEHQTPAATPPARAARRASPPTPTVALDEDNRARSELAAADEEAEEPVTEHDPAEDVRLALSSGEFDLSLQPIVSVERGAAVAFEVFAMVEGSDGGRADIRRPDLTGPELTGFERELLARSIDAARRQMGDVSAELPLHVPVSRAVLASAADVAAIAELLRLHPAIARSLVLSVPLDAVVTDPPGGLRELSDVGLACAIEGWEPGSGEPLAILQVDMLKAEAAMLLPSSKAGADAVAEFMQAAAALGARPVATGVQNDEQAIDLIEHGIDLMVGERFAGPRPLRRSGGPAASPVRMVNEAP